MVVGIIVVGTGDTIGEPPPPTGRGMGIGIGGTKGIVLFGNKRMDVSNRTGDNKCTGDNKATGFGLLWASDSVGLALCDAKGSVDERSSPVASGLVVLVVFCIGNIFFDIFGTC